ncbi:MAG TPA: TonB-dependent receptor plug domain-containing protein [Opitutaceae bacterium]|nr:TonB-dependent receptor plug domain-containing protein [Opitutaceae bacterium]
MNCHSALRPRSDRPAVRLFSAFCLFITLSLAAAAADTPAAPAAPATSKPPDTGTAAEPIVTLEKFVASESQNDPNYILPNAPSESSFGFTKSLLETPRAVSYISSEQLSLLGISTVEDVARAVPGVATNMRFGLQGGIWVRGVPADTYFRGMKRLTQLGTNRTTFAGMDSIEIVKGPPSPIYGMGKIGGYTNYVPKSGRAKIGTYLTKEEGFVQAVTGSYNRNEASFGVGGPFSPGGKQGGYYVYGLLENSDTYIRQVPAKQKFLQGSVSINDFIGKFRLETGGQFQNSITAGGFMNRVTQDEISNGNYIRGMPLVNLDSDGDGKISYLEMVQNSPVKGNLSSTNLPLQQRFAWPKDASGNLLPIGQFPKVSGIPQSFMDYLTAHPEADPTGLIRAQGVGAPLPMSGYLPVGFALDPRTVSVTKIDRRRNGGLEKLQDSKMYVAYLDLINDSNPDLTIKNQLFFDKMVELKSSENPFAEKQDDYAAEDKLTISKRFGSLPEWISVNSLVSLNLRHISVKYKSGGVGSISDVIHRNDVMRGDGVRVPNTTFWNWIDNESLAPASTVNLSQYYEEGAGLLFDVDLFKHTNVVVGTRYDYSPAKFVSYGAFNGATGTTANPGAYTSTSAFWKANGGSSVSVSLSEQLPFGLRPYVTWARESVGLEGDNDVLSSTTVLNHIGQARMVEGGIKATLLKNKLFLTSSAYTQNRANVERPDDPLAGATVSTTVTRGFENEIKWVPTKNLSVTGYAMWMNSHYGADTTATVDLPASILGFKDVVDPATGKVIYPANAFLYGGLAAVVLPIGQSQYRNFNTQPERQFGFNTNYRFDNGFGLLLGGTYANAFYADRLRTLLLPAATVINTGVSWDGAKWHVRLNVFNANDEMYFRPRNRDFDPERLSAMPGRRWELTMKTDF